MQAYELIWQTKTIFEGANNTVMDNLLLYSRLSSLPENMKEEVAAFIDKLLSQKNKQPKKAKAKFGNGKGMFIVKPNFDEPLEDFNEYMH